MFPLCKSCCVFVIFANRLRQIPVVLQQDWVLSVMPIFPLPISANKIKMLLMMPIMLLMKLMTKMLLMMKMINNMMNVHYLLMAVMIMMMIIKKLLMIIRMTMELYLLLFSMWCWMCCLNLYETLVLMPNQGIKNTSGQEVLLGSDDWKFSSTARFVLLLATQAPVYLIS